ncbi:OsmC family protein [Jannaschia aquimarina]|uniref:OsmC protein n=1 Tax=Jannaschia aquimarina TaxID=935700 RepID=A0A0D1ELT6_9RHOB|nr:OsmC family protein [Jannaschia aquimarina]KIT17931.1 Peroxiredoxin OsmC [Jannaschia aquimarina]SNT08684.1 osmotically inducible protein OsmC [Jannaschia aquimarina]
MAIKKRGNAHWEGTLKEGNGTVSTASGALEANPYGFNTRFEGQPGTNPEELIAAAHASCFSMAFSMVLGQSDLTPSAIDTECTVTLEEKDGGFAVTASHLTVSATVPGASEDQVREAAEGAKANCPISKLLNAEITMDLTVS